MPESRKIKAYRRRYYQENSDRIKASGRAYYAKNKQACNQKGREYRRDNPEKYLLAQAKRRAREKSLPFSITVEDIVIPHNCPVLGVSLSIGGDRETSPTLDRIRPSLGYVPGNVIVISYRANRIKNDASLEEIEALFNWMRSVL